MQVSWDSRVVVFAAVMTLLIAGLCRLARRERHTIHKRGVLLNGRTRHCRSQLVGRDSGALTVAAR
jgi:hypothetical protein